MIENFAPASPAGEARIVIRPNRSLTVPQLVGVSSGFAAVLALVSAMSWLQGNTFAPLFALIELLVFAGCLALVWRRGAKAEVIAVDASHIRVRRLPELADLFDAHPAWVRLDTSSGRVVLYSGARRVEVGEWLGLAERQSLARRLADLLRGAQSAAPLAPGAVRGEMTRIDDVVE